MKSISLIALIFLSIFIQSCHNNNYEIGDNSNQFGGISRSSFFTGVKEFSFSQDVIKEIDSNIFGGCSTNPLPLPEGEKIYCTNKGYILSYKFDKLNWKLLLDSNSLIESGICSDKFHNIYSVSSAGILYCVNTGKIVFQTQLPKLKFTSFSNLLSIGDKVFAANSEGDIVCYNSKGKLLWSFKSSLAVTNTFSASNEYLFFNLSDNFRGKSDSLLILNYNGKKVDEIGFDNLRLLNSPVYFENTIITGGIYNKNDEGLGQIAKIKLENGKAKLAWKKEIAIASKDISIDDKGNIYVVGYSRSLGEKTTNGIYSFNTDGNFIWKIYYEYLIPHQLLIAGNEVAFCGSNSKTEGFFILDRNDGNLIKIISMGNYPSFKMSPFIDENGFVNFGLTNSIGYIRLEKTQIEKFVPWE